MIVLRNTTPMGIHHSGPILSRTDAIAPMVFVSKTATRPTQHGAVDCSKGSYYVIAYPPCIGNRAVLTDPNTAVNTAAKMLRKVRVYITIDGDFAFIRMNYQTVIATRRSYARNHYETCSGA
jgi:hypothetical protein